MITTDISGAWRWETDEHDDGIRRELYRCELKNDGFILPGSTCDNMIGRKQELYDSLSKEAARAPRERYEYIGVLWLSKKILIPNAARGKRISLYFERVNISSELWLDGVRVGRRKIGLSTPHIYELPRNTEPGEHTVTLRIDNRNLLNFGDMASGYSIDTQGIWCGIIGELKLIAEDIIHAENIAVYTDGADIRVKMTIASGIEKPSDRARADVTLTVISPAGEIAAKERFSRVLYNSRQPETFELHIPSPVFWDEFSSALYTLNVDCNGESKSVRFGIRTVSVREKRLFINDRPLSLRGTIDCAQYPLSGYPPVEKSVWERNFRIIKSYGLNHVRFHAWCPPSAAFDAADEAGIYVSVEMPLWINRDVTPLEYGDDAIHDMYYMREAREISKTYGNHPCFIMFSNGNETMGNFELLSEITKMMRALDPRRLYTLTSNFDRPIMECEDYFCTQRAYGHDVRIQSLHEKIAEGTYLDYSDAVAASPVPVVSFEVGQYCSFPDLTVCERYTGSMLPVNFDAIRKHMTSRGLYPRLRDYVAASGDLAVRLYREDIEAALRTHGLGGFQLLSLTDYTGQSTATVGLLDVFFESKGFIEPEAFRRFCSDVVPLLKSKRIFKNTEPFAAELDLYDYGKEPIRSPVFRLKISADGTIIHDITTEQTSVCLPLDMITSPTALDVTLSVGEHENSRRVFVFPEPTDVPEPLIVKDASSLRRVIEQGGRAVVTADILSSPTRGSFIPVFWSPVHFPTDRPSGYIIDETHASLAGFPTERYPDYEWKTPLDHSKNADITALDDFEPIIEVVPNFVDCTRRSPLFEARVGGASLLFCGFDLSLDDIPTRQLRNSIYSYAASAAFAPKAEVSPDAIYTVFGI